MKSKILVVDDEAEIRRTIRLQLEGTDFEIIEATNGEEAIDTLGRENILEISVIICDIRMPKINGVEAIAFFQKNLRRYSRHRADRLSGGEARRRLHERRRGRLSRQTSGKERARGGGRTCGRATVHLQRHATTTLNKSGTEPVG